jgi:hypothetical protein
VKESKQGEIAVFDAAQLAEKREGDVSIEELGRAARLPWEVDGRKWHTQDRVSHSGQPCMWDGGLRSRGFWKNCRRPPIWHLSTGMTVPLSKSNRLRVSVGSCTLVRQVSGCCRCASAFVATRSQLNNWMPNWDCCRWTT